MESSATSTYPLRHLIPANMRFAKLSLSSQLQSLKRVNLMIRMPRRTPAKGLFSSSERFQNSGDFR